VTVASGAIHRDSRLQVRTRLLDPGEQMPPALDVAQQRPRGKEQLLELYHDLSKPTHPLVQLVLRAVERTYIADRLIFRNTPISEC
jgi:hypothetical protein